MSKLTLNAFLQSPSAQLVLKKVIEHEEFSNCVLLIDRVHEMCAYNLITNIDVLLVDHIIEALDSAIQTVKMSNGVTQFHKEYLDLRASLIFDALRKVAPYE